MEEKKRKDIKKVLRFLSVIVAFGILFYFNYCKERTE